MAEVTIMGAGSWGLALAILLNNNGHHVNVWSVFPDEVELLAKERENKKCLPGVHIPENIEFSADTEYVVEKSDVIVLAVASPYTRSTAKLFAPFGIVLRLQNDTEIPQQNQQSVSRSAVPLTLRSP